MKKDHFRVLKEEVAGLSSGDTVVEYGSSHTGRLLADFVKQGGNEIRVIQIEPEREKFEEAYARARDLERLEVFNHVPADLKHVQLIFTEKMRPKADEIDDLHRLIKSDRPLLMLPEARKGFSHLMDSLRYDFKHTSRKAREFWVASEKNNDKYALNSATFVVICILTALAICALFLYIVFKKTNRVGQRNSTSS